MGTVNLTLSDSVIAWANSQARASGQTMDQFVSDVLAREQRKGATLTPFQQALFDHIRQTSASHHGMCGVMDVVGGFLSYEMPEIQAGLDALKAKGKIQEVEGGGYYRVAL
jgi:hypothetical protein